MQHTIRMVLSTESLNYPFNFEMSTLEIDLKCIHKHSANLEIM